MIVCNRGAMITNLKSKIKENKVFIIFLIIHLFVWSVLPLIRHLLPVDAMEGIVWGSQCDFGTHKHPPLFGWIIYFFYNLFNHSDFIVYFISQIFIIIGFIYIYKLAKLFFNKEKALCSTMILEGCFTYSYITIFDGFNPNVLIITFFPIISYYFYLALKNNKFSDWILTGLFIGLCFLSKYQAALIVASMFLFTLICKKYRKTIFNYKALFSIIVAFIINIPHLLWLVKNNFFSWYYFLSSETPNIKAKFLSLISFYTDQFFAIVGTLVIFLFLYFIYKNNKEEKIFNFEDIVFIICLGFCPIILQSMLSIFFNSRLIGTWGYPMLFMTGIFLYYLFPVKINDKYFSSFLKTVYSVMIILFLVFFILFSVEKNFRSSYPYEKISKDFERIYKEETGKELNFITGYIEFALPLTIYGNTHPQIIFNTYGHKNIWIDENKVKKDGVLIVSVEDDMHYEQLIPYESTDKQKEYKIYKFTIQNKLKMKREYNLFYKIINPDKNL